MFYFFEFHDSGEIFYIRPAPGGTPTFSDSVSSIYEVAKGNVPKDKGESS